MKILYVITKANWGGAQRYVCDLAVAAKAEGFEVTVAYGTPGEMSQKLMSAQVRVVPIKGLGRDVHVSADASSFNALMQILKEERPDVIHLNSSKAGGLGALAARIAGVKRIIFTAHGWAFNEDRPAYQKVLIRFLAYLTVLLSHKTICVSHAVRRDASWMPLVQRKLHMVHLGLREPEYLGRAEAREFLLPHIENGFIIGMLGELHKTKGIFEAIDAFAKIAENTPDAYLLLVGEGGARNGVEKKIAGHGLGKRILLRGHITNASKYLKAFDIFLFPSRTEALGYALLEAGLAALPAIGSNVGGIPELIEHGKTGLLVERGNIDEISTALTRLEGDASFGRTLGEALRTKILKDFSLEKMVKKTLVLYTSAAVTHSTTTSTSNL